MNFRLDYLLSQDHIDSDFQLKQDIFLVVDSDGKIEDIRQIQDNDQIDHHLKRLVIPGLVNSHSHAFQIAMRGYADNPVDFTDWVERYLYPCVDKMDARSFRKTLRFFFKELLRNGITTLGEFHYFHHAENSYRYEFDQILLEEAKRSGIRLALLQSAYNKEYRESQQRFHSTEDSFLKSLNQIEKWMTTNQCEKLWSLSVAPHSLHGATPTLIRTAVNWANERNRKWHIHLAEQKHDIPYSHEYYGKSPLFALQEILGDSLNSNACLVHAVWLSEEEINLFKKLNLNLIYNPMTNMYLGDGISKITQFDFGAKRKIALGTDSNNAFNMFSEAKSMEALQRISSLAMGKLNSQLLLASITSFSGELLNLPVAMIKKDYFADFIEIDFETHVNRSIHDFSNEEIINHLIFSGLDSSRIKNVFLAGKKI